MMTKNVIKTIIAATISANLAVADSNSKTMASLPQPPGPIVALPDYSAPIPPLPTLPEEPGTNNPTHVHNNEHETTGGIPDIVPSHAVTNPTEIKPPAPATPSLPPLPGATNPTQAAVAVPSLPPLPGATNPTQAAAISSLPPLPGATNPTQVNPASAPTGPNPTTPNKPVLNLPVINNPAPAPKPVAPPVPQPDINNLNIPTNPNTQIIINNPPLPSLPQQNNQNQMDQVDLDGSNFSPLVQFDNKPDVIVPMPAAQPQPATATVVPSNPAPLPPVPTITRPEAPASVNIANDHVTSPPLATFDHNQQVIHKPDTLPPLETTVISNKNSKNLNRDGGNDPMEGIYSKEFVEKFKLARVAYKSNHVPQELLQARSQQNSHLPNYASSDDFTRMAFQAVTKNNLAAIRALIDNHKIEINEHNDDGDSLLIQALIYGSSDVARYLITKKIDVNYASADGLTPLHIAVKTSNNDLVNLLVLKGADVNATDKMGKKPVNYVVTSDTSIMKLLTADVIDNKSHKISEEKI